MSKIDLSNKNFVRLVIHPPTAQSCALRLWTGGILISHAFHPTLTFDLYSVGIPVC